MVERQFTEVTLNGQTLKVYHGFPMATVRAETEAGRPPEASAEMVKLMDGLKMEDPAPYECIEFLRQVSLYQSRFVQAYFLLPLPLIDTTDRCEIAAVFDKIMEVKKLDPFVRSPQSEAAKETPPTTTS